MRPRTLKETVIGCLTGRHRTNGVFWALRDVSFRVEQGKTLGLIGHNGAGKSTLLRLLCGLGRPNAGHIHRRGYVSGLLELGTGFHFEMTGRENIITAGILNGLTKRQVLSCEDEIISFAELEDFVDRPLRTYSTGMYLRLAFATAIHFDPDVLIIDEVLAVGDLRFQQKCIDRLEAFRMAGKTLVLVSHSTDQIRTLCDEVLVLEEGRVMMQSEPETAIRCYTDLMRQRTEKRAAQLPKEPTAPGPVVQRGTRLGTLEATIDRVELVDGKDRPIDTVESGNGLDVVLGYRLLEPCGDLTLLLGIYSELNLKCFETVIPSMLGAFGPLGQEGSLSCRLPCLPLLPGRYYMVVGLFPPDWSYVYDYHWRMHPFTIESTAGIPSGASGFVALHPTWSVGIR